MSSKSRARRSPTEQQLLVLLHAYPHLLGIVARAEYRSAYIHVHLRSLKSDPTCKPGALDVRGRPGSGTNAAGRTHVHIQGCKRNWSRAPALHFGSDFSERNCTCTGTSVNSSDAADIPMQVNASRV